MFLSVRAGLPLADVGLDGKWRGGEQGGLRLLVGGAEALYCCHKSLHDCHLLQSMLTGLFRKSFLKHRKRKREWVVPFSSLRCNISL